MFNKKSPPLTSQELTSTALERDKDFYTGMRLKLLNAVQWANQMRQLLKKDPDEATRLIAFVVATASEDGELKKMADILAGPNLQAVLSGRSSVRAEPVLRSPTA